MEIISISLDEQTLGELNEIQESLGFKSRSKMIRNAIFEVIKDYQALDSLEGEVECIFVVTYRQSEKNHVSDLLHKFEDMIKTELHQHREGICIDVLNISAQAGDVSRLFGILKRNKCVYSVNYSIIGRGRMKK